MDIINEAEKNNWIVESISNKKIVLYKDNDVKKLYIEYITGKFTITTTDLGIEGLEIEGLWILATQETRELDNEEWYQEIFNIIYE